MSANPLLVPLPPRRCWALRRAAPAPALLTLAQLSKLPSAALRAQPCASRSSCCAGVSAGCSLGQGEGQALSQAQQWGRHPFTGQRGQSQAGSPGPGWPTSPPPPAADVGEDTAVQEAALGSSALEPPSPCSRPALWPQGSGVWRPLCLCSSCLSSSSSSSLALESSFSCSGGSW